MAGVRELWCKVTYSSTEKRASQVSLHDFWGHVFGSEGPALYAGLVGKVASHVDIYVGLTIFEYINNDIIEYEGEIYEMDNENLGMSIGAKYASLSILQNQSGTELVCYIQ